MRTAVGSCFVWFRFSEYSHFVFLFFSLGVRFSLRSLYRHLATCVLFSRDDCCTDSLYRLGRLPSVERERVLRRMHKFQSSRPVVGRTQTIRLRATADAADSSARVSRPGPGSAARAGNVIWMDHLGRYSVGTKQGVGLFGSCGFLVSLIVVYV